MSSAELESRFDLLRENVFLKATQSFGLETACRISRTTAEINSPRDISVEELQRILKDAIEQEGFAVRFMSDIACDGVISLNNVFIGTLCVTMGSARLTRSTLISFALSPRSSPSSG